MKGQFQTLWDTSVLFLVFSVCVFSCTQKKLADKGVAPFLNVNTSKNLLDPLSQLMGSSISIDSVSFEMNYSSLGFVEETLYQMQIQVPPSAQESFLYVSYDYDPGSFDPSCIDVEAALEAGLCLTEYASQFKVLNMNDVNLLQILAAEGLVDQKLGMFVLSVNSLNGASVSQAWVTQVTVATFHAKDELLIDGKVRLYLHDDIGEDIQIPIEGTKVPENTYWEYTYHDGYWAAPGANAGNYGPAIQYNDPFAGPAGSPPGEAPLMYYVHLETAGCYRIRIRSKFDGAEPDQNNDVWMSFQQEPNTHYKVFSANPGLWQNNCHTRREISHHLSTEAHYCFNEPGFQTLRLEPRSSGFGMDHIQMYWIPSEPQATHGGGVYHCNQGPNPMFGSIDDIGAYLFIPSSEAN